MKLTKQFTAGLLALSLNFGLCTLNTYAQNNALILNGAYIIINGGTTAAPLYLIVNQSSTSGIISSGGGHIVSEGQYNFITWNSGTGTSNYIFPFGVGTTDYIPFTFNKTTAGSSDISVSTWATTSQNMPHPDISNVAAVTGMICTADSVSSAIDRFWDIQSSAPVTAGLTFSYRGSENTITGQTDTLMAQHWNGTSWDAQAGPGNPGVTVGIGTVGPIPGQTTFSPWILTRALRVTASAIPTTICSGSSVQLDATIFGGSGTYTYSWSSVPAGFSSSLANPIVSPTVNTTYNVTVSNCATNATSSISVTVNPSPVINSEASTDATSCVANDGTITITASGGTPPLQYSINGGSTFSGSGSFTGLSAGSYPVAVTDTNGCTVTGSTLIINAPGAPLAPVAGTNATYCAGDPVADLTATGTNIEWFSDPGLTTLIGTGSPFAISPAVGTTTYYVTQTVSGCQSPPSSVVITVNAIPPVPTAGTNATYCAGAIIADLTATGSNIEWFSDPVLTTLIGTGSPFAITPGVGTTIYYVTQTVSGCQSTADSVVIIVNVIPSAPTAGTNATYCAGDTVAGLTATGSNIEWFSDPGLTTSLGTGSPFAVTPGVGTTTYYVTQTLSGCQSQADSVIITVNSLPVIDSISSTDATTCSASDGTITITASGGTPPFQYSIDGGIIFSGSGSFTGLSTGSYPVVVADTNGCLATGNVFITAAGAPPAPAAGTNATYCAGDPIADLTASGTNIEWFSDPGLTTLLGTGSPFAIFPLIGTTTYYVTQTVSGCQSPPSSVVITVNPIATSTTTTAICQGDSILLGGAFQTTTGNYNDTIFGGSSLGCDSVITIALTVNPVATSTATAAICQGDSMLIGGAFQTTTGNYNDTIFGGSSSGCDSVATTTLTVNPIPSAPTAGTDATYCAGAPIAGLTATGINIEWFSDPGLTTSLGTGSPLAISPGPGITTYYATQTISGCQSPADLVQINIIAGVIAGFNAVPTTGEVPLEVQFTDTSTGASLWSWDFGDGTATSTLQNPTHIYNDAGLFNVILTVFDPLSVCTDTFSVSIIAEVAEEVPEIFIPDIFSPNGDGENDVFYISGKGIDRIHFWIYDRWGEIVFESADINYGWDGKYKGKEMNAGVFIYRLEVTFLNGNEFSEEGDITLIR